MVCFLNLPRAHFMETAASLLEGVMVIAELCAKGCSVESSRNLSAEKEMMKPIVFGAAFLWLLTGLALAQEPMQLNDKQMDKLTAGTLIIETSNTSATAVSLFQRAYLTEPTPNFIVCPGCYLLINSPTFSVASQFGPTFSAGTQFPP